MAESQEFRLSLEAFIAKAMDNVAVVVQKTSVDLLTNVVMRTPVGNPELWAVNATAATYNSEVAKFNSALRNDASNLDKRGYLRRGKKLNDGMDIVKPAGYVGGRLRANWGVSLNSPLFMQVAEIDPSGNKTIADGRATINTWSSGDTAIYMVNNLPYAMPVEYGHSKRQSPAGMVRVTAAEFQTYVSNAIVVLPK